MLISHTLDTDLASAYREDEPKMIDTTFTLRRSCQRAAQPMLILHIILRTEPPPCGRVLCTEDNANSTVQYSAFYSLQSTLTWEELLSLFYR